MSSCRTVTNSRKLEPSPSATVADVREPGSVAHTEPGGSTTSDPTRPLLEPLSASAGSSPTVPSSTGRATTSTPPATCFQSRSPAYQVYTPLPPGATRFASFAPAANPSPCRTPYATSCGCNPTRLDGRTSFALKETIPPSTFSSLCTIAGNVLNPGLSGIVCGSAFERITSTHSPAAARSTSGSTGVPGFSAVGLPL